MKAFVALVCLVGLALAGCSLLPGHGPPNTWVDPEAHVVDGYWVGAERPCTGTCARSATAAISVASPELVEPSSRFATAGRLQEYFTQDGLPGAIGESGPILAVIRNVVIDTPDRTRRLVTLFCRTPATDPGVTAETCELGRRVLAPRLGEEPWTASGG